MYKVMLVDDEILTIEYLRRMSVWEKYECNSILHAVTVSKAISIFEEEKPDIVFLDVRMPKMNGLDLGKKFLSISPDTSIVIMTAYQEFEYVKEAIQNGMNYFLVKHELCEEKMEEVLGKVTQELKKKSDYQTLLRDDVIRRIYNGDNLPEFQLRGEYLFVGIALYSLEYILGETETIKLKKELLTQVVSQFHLKAYTRLGSHCIGTLWEYDRKKSEEQNHQEVYTFCKELETKIRHESMVLPVILASNIGRSQNSLLQESIEYLHMIEKCVPMRSTNLIFLEDIHSASFISERDFYNGKTRIEWEEQELSVLYENTAKATFLDQKAFDLIRELIEDEELREYLKTINEEHMVATVSGIIRSCLYENRERKSRYGDNQLLINAVTYIETHYSQELSSQEIAEHLYISEGYLRSVFKKSIGCTIKEYVLEKKIGHAKKLLQNHKLKVYEVAEQCGFSSSQHFARVFLRETGMTPAEYRKRN